MTTKSLSRGNDLARTIKEFEELAASIRTLDRQIEADLNTTPGDMMARTFCFRMISRKLMDAIVAHILPIYEAEAAKAKAELESL